MKRKEKKRRRPLITGEEDQEESREAQRKENQRRAPDLDAVAVVAAAVVVESQVQRESGLAGSVVAVGSEEEREGAASRHSKCWEIVGVVGKVAVGHKDSG